MKTKHASIILAAFALLAPPLRAENETGFIEKFALAADREKILAEMAPGTEEYFFFHALHDQNTKQTAKLAETMKAWREAFPNSAAPRDIIENREALLGYDTNPKGTINRIINRLGLHFNHQQEVRDQKPNLPTTLDRSRISREVYLRYVFQYNDLSGLSERELERLVRDKTPLQLNQVRALLSRITRPDVPGLVEMIAEDLKRQNAPGFGAFPIHGKLLPEQLDQHHDGVDVGSLERRGTGIQDHARQRHGLAHRWRQAGTACWRKDFVEVHGSRGSQKIVFFRSIRSATQNRNETQPIYWRLVRGLCHGCCASSNIAGQ